MTESATNVMESAAVFGADVDSAKNLETHQYVGTDTATSYTPQTTEKVLCGWGTITPASCQRFRKPGWFLFWLCWAGALQGMVVNGYINVVISTIERRFEISSTESGAIASCYDIASVICLIPVTYFGGRGLKPAYVGIGIFVMALGSFTFALPHFTSIPYETNDTQVHMCQPEVNLTSCSTRTTGLSDYKYVFFLGQLLHGAGASPLYTLGTTYLDENLSVRSAALYQGTFYAFAIVGPAIGYLAGGAFLNINEYFTAPDTAMPSIDKDSPAWVGAWWIGFLISGVLGVLISIPLCAFPMALPGSDKYRIEHEKEVYHGKVKTESKPGIQSLGCADICFTLKLLLVNPTFMLLNLAAAFNGIIVSGFSTFTPKFIEYQFSLSSGMAAQYVGFAAIPAGGGATFLGGYLVKHFNLTVRGILKLCIVSTFIAVFFSLVFLIHCNNVPFAGVNLPYYKDNRSLGFIDKPDFLETCNADCGCSQQNYFPVCGKDGVMYYSPCYAGCLSVTGTDVKYYNNCSCIKYVSNGESWMAQQGKCESDCSWLPVFMPLFTVVMFGIFITSMPALAASLRCIPQEKRSFALGIQWIIARCLGSIPGPIIFGKIIDVTCKLWQKRCDGDGACYFYDNKNMSYNLLSLGIVCVFFSALCFLFALVFYRTASSCEDSTHIDTQSVDSLSVCTNMTFLTHLSTLNGTAVSPNDAPVLPNGTPATSNGTSVNCNGMSATAPTIVLDAAMLRQPNSVSSHPDCESGVIVKTDVLNTFQSDVCIDRRCTAIHSFHIHI